MPAPRPSARCYVASPFGFSEPGRHYYRAVVRPALASVVVPVDPWSLTGDAEVAAAVRGGRESEMAREIGRRNIAAIRDADLVVAWLDGQEIDAGTAAEIGFAAALGLPCFGIRTDLRQTGEFGATVNLQVEAFILASGGSLTTTVDGLLAALRAHVSR